jgi:ABC-type transport system involved in multi-copper enzyme maturation permease subunit
MIDKILIISKYTFKELIKSRILYITLIIGLALMVVTYVATEFTYGVPQKVALDFGLGMLSFSSMGISLFMGATLLYKEIDSRTVYMVISRPVPRWIFITGKIVGLIFILLLNIGILSLMTLACSSFLGGAINEAIILSIFFNLIESVLLLLVVVFFSLFMNNTLATVISLTILILGHAIKDTQNILFVQERPYIKYILELYHFVLPSFHKLNLKDFVIYNQTIETSYILNSLTYGFGYSLFLFLMIIYLFNRKNLD